MSNLEGNLFASYGTTVSVSVTATAQAAALGASPAVGAASVWVANAGASTIYVKFGAAGQTAVTVTTGIPVLSGVARPFSIGANATEVSVICAATETAEAHFALGAGV
jgi:hypothetical protein